MMDEGMSEPTVSFFLWADSPCNMIQTIRTILSTESRVTAGTFHMFQMKHVHNTRLDGSVNQLGRKRMVEDLRVVW